VTAPIPVSAPVPPRALDAEFSVLAGLVADPDAPARLRPLLKPQHFRAPLHGRLYAALQADAGRLVDLSLLARRFEDDADFVQAGGTAWLHALAAAAPRPERLLDHARQVLFDAARRAADRAADPQAWVEITRRAALALQRCSDGTAIKATPYVWRDPATLPRRDFLYGRHYARGFCSATFAPGGVGKSAHAIVEALAMVTGKPLLGERVRKPLKVWILNLEDPKEETERRVGAALIHYGIARDQVEGRLFLDSGRDTPVVVATPSRQGVTVVEPLVDQIEAEIERRMIDLVIVDPFVACHEVNENDNAGVNTVAGVWRRIADRKACAVELIHHARKQAPGEHGPMTADDGRGASALKDATRSARVLNPMTDKEAEDFKVEDARGYFRVTDGKANLAPRSRVVRWRQLVSVDLRNGPPGDSDEIGVATAWDAPEVAAQEAVPPAEILKIQQAVEAGGWRHSDQATQWVGNLIAETLGIDLERPGQLRRVKELQKKWEKEGLLVKATAMDDHSTARPFVEVGAWVKP
jgi:hypothetical protein